MAPLRPILAAFCVLTLALAGCAGGSKAREESPTTSAAVPVVDEDSGAIHGAVIDDQVMAVAGAEVAVVALGLSTRSDDVGAFTLNEVPPGEHVVNVARIGYESKAQKVSVVAGEVTQLQLTLTPIAVAEPRYESIPFAGQFQCSVAALDVLWMDCPGESKSFFYFEKPLGVRHVVGELRWTAASAGTGQNLDFNLVKGTSVADTDSEQWYANTFGASPLRLQVTVGEKFENPKSPSAVGSDEYDQVVDDEDTRLGFNIYSSPTYADDVALIGVTLDQKFNGYVTFFYDMDPPEDFTAFPDG